MPSKRGRAGRARVCGKAHSQLPAVTPSRLLEEAIAHGPEGAGGASSLRPSSISLVENVTRSTRPSQTHASRHHPLLANAAPINQHVRDPQDNKITKPTTTVTNFAENVQTTQDMPSHASAHASTVKSLCGWCGDDFYNDHMRTTTSCCGLAVGDSCLEELYGKDDTCRLCSETRPVKVDSSICLSSEGPIHIKRFINVPQSVSTRQDLNDEDDERYKPSTHSIGDETLHFSLQSSKTTFILDDSDDEDTEHHEPSTYTIPNETLQSSLTTFTLHDLGNEDTEPHEPSTYTTRKDTLKSPKTFSRPLSQASPEAKQIHQARTHILNLLEHFIQAWGNEGAKLRENDRRLIVGRIEKALSATMTHGIPPTPPSTTESSPNRGTALSTKTPTSTPRIREDAANYMVSAAATINLVEAQYAGQACEDCHPMKVRIADALKPGPHIYKWRRNPCRRCQCVREVVGDVVGLARRPFSQR